MYFGVEGSYQKRGFKEVDQELNDNVYYFSYYFQLQLLTYLLTLKQFISTTFPCELINLLTLEKSHIIYKT